jgi:hypothetical protein
VFTGERRGLRRGARHADSNPVLGVARVGWIDPRAQVSMCNPLRSDTPTHPVVLSGVATPRGETRAESHPPGPA